MPTPKKLPFKIGADPEFNLIIDDQHFCAEALLEDMFSGKLKAKDMGYEIPDAGEIGWDGNNDIAELRPKPANSPEELTANLKKLISKIAETNPLLEMSTLCDMGTVGGHIHFELSPESSNATRDAISRKLGSFYLPIIMSEDRLNLRTRNKSSYGKLTDYRAERHGNSFTFEFRAPSAEWLTTEEIAKSTLAYLATVYNEIVKHPKNFAKCNGLIFKNRNQGDALKDLAISDFRIIMHAITSKIRKYIHTFEFYRQYKKEIDFILSANRVNKAKEKAGFNLAIGWGLVKYKQPSKRQLFSRIDAKKEKENLDQLAKLVKIDYNSDINVGDFANSLKVKIARFHWKLNNHYFLFGLKKGVNDFIITNKNFEFLNGQKQIETTNDLYYIKETIKRMITKFPNQRKRRLDSNNDNYRKYILIGIPYDLRINGNTKPLIEKIYEIEKGRMKAAPINRTLPEYKTKKDAESNEPIRTIGRIATIYNQNCDRKEDLISEERRSAEAACRLEEAENDEEREMTESLIEELS